MLPPKCRTDHRIRTSIPLLNRWLFGITTSWQSPPNEFSSRYVMIEVKMWDFPLFTHFLWDFSGPLWAVWTFYPLNITGTSSQLSHWSSIVQFIRINAKIITLTVCYFRYTWFCGSCALHQVSVCIICWSNCGLIFRLQNSCVTGIWILIG